MTRFVRIVLMIGIVQYACAQAFSAHNIYLKSNHFTGASIITLGSVAEIFSDQWENTDISQIEIPLTYAADGYIDRGEIQRVLKEKNIKDFCIFGSSVRIYDDINATNNADINRQVSVPVGKVRRGSNVKVVLRNGIIKIECYGKLLRDAHVGESVSVSINGENNLPGILKDARTVEIAR